MRKILILVSFICSFIISITASHAQVFCPCPDRFTVSDSGCTKIDIIRTTNGYFATDSIRACKGSKVTYTISFPPNGCSYAGIQYTYNVTNGTLVSNSGSQFTIQWGNTSPASVTINYLYSAGAGGQCAGSFTILALLTPNPVAAFSISPNPACFNNPTTINFNSNASVNALNYFWDFGDGFQGTGPNPTHNYTLPGTYVITLIVTSTAPSTGGGTIPNQPPCAQCSDSVKHTLVINNLPGPPIECVATVCAGETATYCTTPLGCATYTWTVVGGTINSGQGTPCIQVTWGSGNPQGSITLVITGCPNYCAQGTTVTVPIIPATTTISGPTPVCVNTSANYFLPPWPGTTYNWTLSGGGTITGNNTNTPQININWTAIGTFIITCNYFDSSKECGGVGTLSVTVLPTARITGTNKFCAGSSTTLTAKDQFNNLVPSTWTVSPAGTSFTGGNTGSTVTITSNTPGTYTVTATPNSGTACNVPTYTITVLPKPILNAILGADSVCAGQPYVYAISSNTTGLFTWTITNGTAVYLTANKDSAQITWAAGGPYSISITQTSANGGCVSNPQIKSVFPYPTPVINGPTNVCADNIVSYTISNIGNHPFNWYVSPGNYGTIQGGQGTNTITIKWHGSVNPGSNTVYLHVSFCKDDSIAVTINKPVPPVFTVTGTLCGIGGISLNPNATGSSFSWTCAENPYTSNLPVATGITLPGHYTVTIGNYNGTGCSVTATYFVPDIGRPTANISANNVLNYCLPNLPNLSLVAASGFGYSYQWRQLPSNTIIGTNSPTLLINNLTLAGTYSYYCIVSLNGCSVSSNIITITISNCTGNPGGPGCTGAIGISNITGCNPFVLTVVATAPSGGTIVGGTTTISYPSYPITSGNTTMTFDSVGYKQITICANIALPGGGTTTCCKDTVVLVTVASKFLANNNCGVVTLTDLSTVIFPAVINNYNWSVGFFPGNGPVPIITAFFNNPTLQNPVLTFTQSGTYIITQQVTSGSCIVLSRDTIVISIPNAAFTVNNSCVGTPVILNPGLSFASYYWDFGDAATSYTMNTSHAYASSGTFIITHTVTDVNGCTNTVTQPITIIPKPTCTISYTGPTAFCSGDSLVLNACPGFSSYQWFRNGTAIPLATNLSYTALITGNYYFTALNVNGCVVNSDTVNIVVTPAPSVVITTSGSRCVGGTFTIGVPSCNSCIYTWTDNNNIIPGFNTNQGSFPVTAGMVGVHTYAVTVFDPNTGCSATGSVIVTFYNNPTVSISVVPNPPVLCSNNIYTMTATSNASSPSWSWIYNAINVVLSVTNTLNASAGGTYTVNVTDGITGCAASANKVIRPSPDLSLFPNGCDTLCDTAHIFLPIGSINGNISNYTITWYRNAPPYTNIIGTGPSINLNSLPLGNNSISVIVINNLTGCTDTSNNYNIFIKHCGKCSCVGSQWDSLYWHLNPIDAGPNANIGIPPVDSAFFCGKNLGQFNCKTPITIFAKFKCNPSSCDSAVKYVLTGPVTMTGVMPFSTSGLPAGNYVLILTGKCGDSTCKVCDVPFSIKCDTVVNCCLNSHWVGEGPLWINKTIGTSSTVICNSSRFIINTANNNCYSTYLVKGNFICGNGCPPKLIYQLYDSVTNNLINSSNDSLLILPTLPNGSYYVKVLVYCGTVLCQTCNFKFIKACICDCNPNKEIDLSVTTNGVVKKYKCGDNLGIINCKINTILNGSYQCNPAACPSVLSYQLIGPYNTTTGNLPLTLNTLTQGSYTLNINAYCNGRLCKLCKLTFTVKCDSIPPPPCCPYNISISTNSTAYSLTPSGNATISSPVFTISGLAGVPLSEVKAEVMSYNISSNYNNECLTCKTLPFTWASISSATTIGTVIPKITLFGTTTTTFLPTGTAVYQNPREVVWSSSTTFLITNPIGISILLPPPPVIACCEYSGRICVKFTFKDSRCRICEVIACYNFTITNGNIFKLSCPNIVKAD